MMIDEDGSSGVPAGYKYYYFQDRRFSVVALAATSTTGVGVVGERYRYTAFGEMTVHQASGGWLPSTSSASLFENPYGYTGRRYDAETATATSPGLWHYRNRMYSASLGRFMQRDPAGYIDGFNLYAYVRNNPLGFVDALGLARLNTGSSQFNTGSSVIGLPFNDTGNSGSSAPAAPRGSGGYTSSIGGLLGGGWGLKVGTRVEASAGSAGPSISGGSSSSSRRTSSRESEDTQAIFEAQRRRTAARCATCHGSIDGQFVNLASGLVPLSEASLVQRQFLFSIAQSGPANDAAIDATFLGVGNGLAVTGLSVVPGNGEVLDFDTLADPNAGRFAKVAASLSLALSAYTYGLSPNAGSFRRAFLSLDNIRSADNIVVSESRFADLRRTERLLFNTGTPSNSTINPTQFQKMKRAFERNGGIIDQSDDIQALLQAQGARGVTFNQSTIGLPPNPTTTAVFEEFIHTAQHRTGSFQRLADQHGTVEAIRRLEVEAAQKLIRNRRAYQIPPEETSQTIDRLRALLKEADAAK